MHSIVQYTRRPDVSFYSSGRIDITSRVARAIGIADGDVISIAESDGEYYIYCAKHADAVVGSHQGTVHPTKQHSRNFRCYSSQICHILLTAHGITGRGQSLRVPAGRVIQHPQFGTMMSLVTMFSINSQHKTD